MNATRDQSNAIEQASLGQVAPGSPLRAESTLSSETTEQPILRLDLLRSLQLHRWVAIGLALAGFTAALGYLLFKGPVYTAQSLVYVQPAPKVMDQGSTSRWSFDTNSYEALMAQQIISVTRNDVLGKALRKLTPVGWQHVGESDQAASERLGGAIEVKRMGTSYQLSITARSTSAAMAARLANAVAESYIESASRDGKSGDDQRLATLREEKERIEKALAADRAEQQDLNKVLGTAAIGTVTPDPYDEGVSQIQAELVKARTAHDAAAAGLTSMDATRAPSEAALEAEAEQMVAADPGMVSMKTSLNQHRALLITQMANLSPTHPEYKQDAEQLLQIDASLEAMRKDLLAKASSRIQQQLRTELNRTAEVEGRLNLRLGQLTGAAASATPKMQRANDLATDIVRLQNRFTIVDEQLHNLMIEDSVPGASYLAAAAVPPLGPERSGVLRTVMVLALGGIFLGIASAVLSNKLDQKIYIAADIERLLGFSPMAVLPDFDQVSAGVAEEHLMRLASGIEFDRQQGRGKICIFTGAGPRTGVSTVVTRVQSMLETMGRAASIVDASGTPPPVTSAPSGSSGESSQLVTQHGGRSTALLQYLAEESQTPEERMILTDAAPLSLSAETEYMARFVDATIVVVESGVTTRKQLRDVANSLQRLQVPAAGFVLNRVGLKFADPSFRQSVRATERHLRSQSRSSGRSPEANRPPSSATPKAERISKEEGATTNVATHTHAHPAIGTETGPHATSRVIPELAATPQEFSPVPPRIADFPQAEEITCQPTLRDAVVLPAQFPQQMAEIRQTEMPCVAEHPSPVWGSETQISAAQPLAELPGDFPQAPPPQTWERTSARLGESEERVAQEEVLGSGGKYTQSGAATRMSELRKLMISKGAMKFEGSAKSSEEITTPPPQEEAGGPASARTFTPLRPASVRKDTLEVSSTLVTAPPEFLPPKVVDEPSEANKGKGHLDRREYEYDDVQILPARHGQYRNKK